MPLLKRGLVSPGHRPCWPPQAAAACASGRQRRQRHTPAAAAATCGDFSASDGAERAEPLRSLPPPRGTRRAPGADPGSDAVRVSGEAQRLAALGDLPIWEPTRIQEERIRRARNSVSGGHTSGLARVASNFGPLGNRRGAQPWVLSPRRAPGEAWKRAVARSGKLLRKGRACVAFLTFLFFFFLVFYVA